MAKNFGKSPAAKRFGEVAKNTMANTNITAVKLIENSMLVDYPNNGEDIFYTADIENSINEMGFTDPIEVTDFNMPDGQYMIVSGHRRRSAGVKCGMDLFPCIVKSFDNENDVNNYVLLANSQRDSSKDPLLYCNRYKMHEQHLKTINFQGSVRDEIAKRLGISVRQADRYNQMNKIISPVWDLVRDELVGMSSVLPMAELAHDDQHEIYEILQINIDKGIELTRDKISFIIKNYKNPVNSKKPDRDGDAEKTEEQQLQKKRTAALGSLKTLNDKLTDLRDFGDEEETKNLLKAIEETVDVIFGKLYTISKRYELDGEIQKIIETATYTIQNIR